MRSKVYSLERTVRFSKYGSKRCQVSLDVSETDIFEFFQTKRQYKINHHLSCNDKCLIYSLSCKICGLQYFSFTTDRFRLRWNNYKDNDRKAQGVKSTCNLNYLSIFIQRNIMGFYKIAVLLWSIKQMVQTLQDVKSTSVWCLKQWPLMGWIG